MQKVPLTIIISLKKECEANSTSCDKKFSLKINSIQAKSI